MRPIFVSYRREDAEGEAGRLFDDLVGRFGESAVFLDVAAIEVGRDFRKAIDESVSSCGVLLAVIGKGWCDAKTEDGHRRLDDPSDFVRLETASALKRDIPVIPVLVHGAKMPRAEQLPEDIQELAYRNGVELTHARWRSDVELLIKALCRHVEVPESSEGNTIKMDGNSAAAPPPAAPLRPLDETPRTPEKPPAPWWKSRGAILTFVLGALALVAGVYWLQPRQVIVPDVTGTTLADATARLEAANLVVGGRNYQFLPDRKPETVLSQSPSPNAHVGKGTAVNLVVAKTLAETVPDIKGKQLEEAELAIVGANLVVGSISREQRSDVAKNAVIDVFPIPGKKVDAGTAIDLVVSEGPAPPAPVTPPASDRPAQKLNVSPALSTVSPGVRNVSPGVPNFAGTWSPYERTIDGVTEPVPNPRPISVTQNGTVVHINDRDLPITSVGTISYQTFLAARDGKHGAIVGMPDQADLVNTYTWKIQGAVLIFEIVSDYKRQYLNQPPGKKTHIMRYRRTAAQ